MGAVWSLLLLGRLELLFGGGIHMPQIVEADAGEIAQLPVIEGGSCSHVLALVLPRP